MKHMLKQTMIALLLLGNLSTFAQSKEVRVAMKGLVCALCGQGLEKKFKAFSEIQKVTVQFGSENPKTQKKENILRLELSDGKLLTKDQIEAVVKDAGYTISNIEGL